jgi:hypothetical protein
MTYRWLDTLTTALATLARAEAEAEAALPAEIKQEHRALVRGRQVVTVWAHLSRQYPQNRALEALALIAGFRSRVQALEFFAAADEAIAAEKTASPQDLRIGKHRQR